MLTLRKNLKEMLYKYLLFFATNYGRITILYKEEGYLEVMEDILLFYCDVIKEFFRDQKRRNEKMKVIQEARRIKMLLRDCLLRKMDRILHVLLKVRLAPEVEEYGMLWGDVYMYFLTKVPYKHTDDDILRGFIAFQKFKTIRVKSESAMIDKLMLEIYKKSTEELRRIPCLGEIIDRMKRDRLYTVRDMVASYMRYYNEKRSQSENFQLEDVDEDTVDENVNELRHLDLTGSLLSVPSTFDTGSPAAQLLTDRRKGVRKTVLDMAVEPGPQFEQYNTDFSLFGDVAKKEAPEEPVVILDDEDDDVIVVCDNLRNVITIDDDDDDDGEPVHSRPIRSPPSREALSPDRVLLRPDAQSPPNAAQLDENHAPNRVDHADTSPPEQTPIADEPEKDTLLRPPTNKDDSVPENILPKEPRIPKNMEASVPKRVQIFEAPISTRLVKKVDNSLRITINSVPYPDGGSVENVPVVELHRPKRSSPGESQPEKDEKSMSAGEFTESAGTDSGLNLDKRPEILPTEVTCLPSTFEKDRFGTSQEKISGSDDLTPPKSTDKPENQQVDKPESQRMTPPMEIEEQGGAVTAAPRTAEPLQDRSPEPKSQRNQSEENPMEIDCPSLSEAFERRGSMINSTMNDDSEPTSNDNVRPPRRDGVLPSSKIPSDLDESPEKFSRAINLSDTSNVSQQSSIMFKDNPFIGQNVNIGSPNNQPAGYLYTPEIEHIASLTAPHAHTVQNTAPVPAPAKAKIVPASAKPRVAPNQGKSVSKPEPIQFPAQIYNDPALISHDNMYFDQSNLRLPDISTLKDPRRKNNKNFAQAHEMAGSNMARSVPATVDPMAQNSGFLQSYRRDVEKLPPRMATPAPEQSKMIHDSAVQATDTQKIIRKNTSLHAAPKMEESNPAETSQECLQKAQLPPKKRKLTDDEELAIYIQKFKEEKERKKKLEENISYPAQRQMSIADLQRDFPKAKTLAARKLCPEGTGGYPDQNYYEYPPGYEQYGDFNDYGNKRSIMNVYINGGHECSANYPLCLMIGTVHTCVNNANSTPEAASNNKPEHSDDAVQARPTAEVPQYAELTTPAENYQNIQKNIVSNVVARQGADVPPARPKRNRKAGASAEEAPAAKRGRGRPRKIIN